ncbi:DNA polymerase III subunit delta [Corynebacterium ulceribovis]|uniref:DNA polymerase III subunit delta n=1 Tax=Corynebacterium ulceribovis TaxID=487732 RepID=UPI00039DCD74|nr:DNA polymerase III subunit delta [Corynebacterium ulceribovis]
MTTQQVAPLTVLNGREEFLMSRARRRLIAAVKASSPAPEAMPITEFAAKDVTDNDLVELLSPSLFSEERVLVFTDLQSARKEATDTLVKWLKDIPEGIVVIVEHVPPKSKTAKGAAAALKQLQKLGAELIEYPELKPSEIQGFVHQELRGHKIRADLDTVQAIVEGVGTDLRDLASAISQLVADTDGNFDADKVREYYSGRAEINGFHVADAAVAGNVVGAVAATRRALQLGEPKPVVLAAAISGAIGDIARLHAVGPIDPNRAAGTFRMPPWKVRKVQQVARLWPTEAVARAVQVVADMDAGLKGAGSQDEQFVLETSVRKIAEIARSTR